MSDSPLAASLAPARFHHRQSLRLELLQALAVLGDAFGHRLVGRLPMLQRALHLAVDVADRADSRIANVEPPAIPWLLSLSRLPFHDNSRRRREGMVRPFTTASGFGPLPDIVRDIGGQRLLRRIFADADLPVALCEQRHLKLPLACMVDVFERSASVLGDPLLGVRVGERMEPCDYGPWTSYFLAAPTLGEALQRCDRAAHFHTDGVRLPLRHQGDLATWTLSLSRFLPPHRRHYIDHILLPMLKLITSFAGPRWRPLRLEVEHRPGRLADAMRERLDVDIRFGAVGTRVMFDAALLGRRAAKSPGTNSLTFRDIRRAICSRPPRTVAEACREVLRARLRDGDGRIDPAARLLCMGVRTLQRRLHQEGTSFREIAEGLRAERGVALVVETELPLREIAASLGFLNQAHFTRAFQRWTGRPPSALRAEARRARRAG
jgi:AraC-like DNA-binding protein